MDKNYQFICQLVGELYIESRRQILQARQDAIQELQEENRELKARNEELEEKWKASKENS